MSVRGYNSRKVGKSRRIRRVPRLAGPLSYGERSGRRSRRGPWQSTSTWHPRSGLARGKKRRSQRRPRQINQGSSRGIYTAKGTGENWANEQIRESDEQKTYKSMSDPVEVPWVAPTPPNLDNSHKEAEAAAYEEGYRQGVYDGGEAKLGQLIPKQMILPELTVDDVILAGMRSLTSSLVPLITTDAVSRELNEALIQGRPFSLVRLGDGELLTLAHDTVMPVEQVQRWGAFLPYAGVNLPDPHARIDMARAISRASIVGIPESRHPSYQGLLFPVLRYYGIDYRKLRLASSIVNYALNEEGWLRPLLTGRKILLIGNESPRLAAYLQANGLQIQGVVTPVRGVSDIQRIMEQIAAIDFDIAFVAAGIAAVILCVRIAEERGKVALDMGHLADKFNSGEMTLN